jgi:hypothetical protein
MGGGCEHPVEDAGEAPKAHRKASKSSWNGRWIAAAIAISAVWGLPPLIGNRLETSSFVGILSEAIDHIVAAEEDGSATRWRGLDAPGITWINFDDRDRLGASSPLTPKPDIANLLTRIRQDPNHAPLLAMLDINIIGPNIPGDSALAKALSAWSTDPRAPPLAIAAGPACQGAEAASGSQVLFDPTPYVDTASPDPRAPTESRGKIVWVCPQFEGLNQFLWVCTNGAPQLGSPTFALPSPAWFAWSIRQSGNGFSEVLKRQLSNVDRSCAGGDSQPIRFGDRRLKMPMISRVRVTFDLVRHAGVDDKGELIVRQLNATNILASPKASMKSLDRRIVVIGSSSRLWSDETPTRMGDAPGALIVAAALRAGWVWGPPSEVSDLLVCVIGTCLILLGAALLHLRSKLRPMTEGAATTVRFVAFLFLYPHLQAWLFLTSAIFIFLHLPGFITQHALVRAGVMLIAIEFLFVVDGFIEEWRNEIT